MRISDWSSDVCSSDLGHAEQADAELAAVRRRRGATGIDLHLAEKVLGAASRRGAVTIEWTGVDQLTAWRYGLAMATGVEIPDKLYATVAPWVTGWRAQSPMLSAAERAVPAQRSEEHTSEIQSLMRISFAASRFKKKI